MKILIVCWANYCRSPVAETILKETLPAHFEVSSAGLDPFPNANMDKRSSNYLNEIGYSNIIHNPKKINLKMVNQSDLIFALDVMVLQSLNRKFSNHKKKFKLLNFLETDLSLNDPFKSDEINYYLIMENIRKICKKIRQYLIV